MNGWKHCWLPAQVCLPNPPLTKKTVLAFITIYTPELKKQNKLLILSLNLSSHSLFHLSKWQFFILVLRPKALARSFTPLSVPPRIYSIRYSRRHLLENAFRCSLLTATVTAFHQGVMGSARGQELGHSQRPPDQFVSLHYCPCGHSCAAARVPLLKHKSYQVIP